MKIFGLNIGKAKETRNVGVPFPITTTSYLFNPTVDATSQACIDLICSTMSSLPLDLYDYENKLKLTEHPLHRLFKEPNADETRSIFFYNLVKDYIYGNVYIYKYYNDEGDITSIFRINPKEVSVYRGVDNKKYFKWKDKEYDYRQIIHIPSRWGYDGTKGLSIFEAAKDVFNTTLEIDEYTNNSFKNSLGNRLLVDISKAFSNADNEKVEAFREKYITSYTGSENAGKPIIVSKQGIEFKTLESGMKDNRANQLLENREFQEKEISKLFGVPLSFLKGENKYGQIEELFMIFIETAIKPIATSFEESFNKLLNYRERGTYYFRFNYNSLVKTNLQSRISAYQTQLSSGILTINEVRAKEELMPVSGGDTNIISGGNFLPIRQDILDAYMISSKLKLQDNHNPNGDDKA